jgi:Flp pilus assembly protein TadD
MDIFRTVGVSGAPNHQSISVVCRLTQEAARLRRTENSREALRVASEALFVIPDWPAALVVRAAAYMDMGDLVNARADAVLAEEIKPSHYTANVLMRLCRLEGDIEAAAAWAQEADRREASGS